MKKYTTFVLLLLAHLGLVLGLLYRVKIGLMEESSYSFILFISSLVIFLIENKITNDAFFKKNRYEALIFAFLLSSIFLPISDGSKQLIIYILASFSLLVSWFNRYKKYK